MADVALYSAALTVLDPVRLTAIVVATIAIASSVLVTFPILLRRFTGST